MAVNDESDPSAEYNKSWEYIITSEGFANKMGYEGDKVVEVWFKDGLWHIKTQTIADWRKRK